MPSTYLSLHYYLIFSARVFLVKTLVLRPSGARRMLSARLRWWRHRLISTAPPGQKPSSKGRYR